MIEELKNCPNCGGILSETGRCKFCGSKIYDFLNIDFSDPYMPNAKTYIRIKSGGKVYLAPIWVSGVNVSLGSILGFRTEPTKINIECIAYESMMVMDDEEDTDVV